MAVNGLKEFLNYRITQHMKKRQSLQGTIFTHGTNYVMKIVQYKKSNMEISQHGKQHENSVTGKKQNEKSVTWKNSAIWKKCSMKGVNTKKVQHGNRSANMKRM